jgi:hypothetical protein
MNFSPWVASNSLLCPLNSGSTLRYTRALRYYRNTVKSLSWERPRAFLVNEGAWSWSFEFHFKFCSKTGCQEQECLYEFWRCLEKNLCLFIYISMYVRICGSVYLIYLSMCFIFFFPYLPTHTVVINGDVWNKTFLWIFKCHIDCKNLQSVKNSWNLKLKCSEMFLYT